MRPVVFVAPHVRMGSARLRAVQISGELNARGIQSRVVPSCAEQRDAILIYIKGDNVHAIESARDRGNIIVVDLIDPHQKTFHRPGGPRLHYHEVDASLFDGVLFVNSFCSRQGRDWSKRLRRAVIPHPWDTRITQPPLHHEHFNLVSVGYSSTRLDHPLLTRIDLPNHVLTDSMIAQMRGFACHFSVRDKEGESSSERYGAPFLRYNSKSNIKVSTAAACGANIITSRDAGSLDVLPADYPFWYNDESGIEGTIKQVADAFHTGTWRMARDMMARVREDTGIHNVTSRYIDFLNALR